jgi:broad specificity phosphatase PhoE
MKHRAFTVKNGRDMVLIAVRHGETEWNIEHREMGQLDSPLTARGVQQAEAIARRLSGIQFDGLYSSDLARAVQTAEIIAARCGKTVRLDPGLRERHMGLLQGLTGREMRAKYPTVRETYDQYGFYDTVPGGETAQQMSERSTQVLTAIADRHPNETVVVVTHSGVLRSFFESILGAPGSDGKRYKRQNASFNSFEYADSRWCLETWNDTSHLL